MSDTGPSAVAVQRLVVELNYDGWRLDRYLTQKLKRASRSRVRRIIAGSVRFGDRRRVKAGSRVKAGELVLLEREERADPGGPSLHEIRILEQSDDWLVLDKPAGLLVHRTARESRQTVEGFLAEHFEERLEPVHRLDRDTSGCLVCGRGLAAIRGLRDRFARRRVDKRYRAVVADPAGHWPGELRATLDTPLGFDSSSAVKLRIGRGDWACATRVEVMARPTASSALLDLSIEGGRQHQIRAHLALQGTPIVGDKLYQMGDAFFLDWIERPGAPDLVERLPVRWHALHAAEVAFEWAGGPVRVSSPLPPRLTPLLG